MYLLLIQKIIWSKYLKYVFYVSICVGRGMWRHAFWKKVFTLRTGDVWDNLVSFLTILSCFRWLQEHFLSLSLLGCHYNDLADRCVNTYPRFPLGSIFSYPPLPLEDNGVCPTQIQPEKNQVPVCSADPLHINAVKIFAYFFFIDNSWNFIFHACFGNGLRIPFLSYTIHRWLLWYVFLCYFCLGSEYLYVKGVKRLIYPPQHGHIVLLDLYDYPYLLFYSWCCIWCVLVWPVSVCYPLFLRPLASFKTIAGIFAHNNDTRVG